MGCFMPKETLNANGRKSARNPRLDNQVFLIVIGIDDKAFEMPFPRKGLKVNGTVDAARRRIPNAPRAVGLLPPGKDGAIGVVANREFDDHSFLDFGKVDLKGEVTAFMMGSQCAVHIYIGHLVDSREDDAAGLPDVFRRKMYFPPVMENVGLPDFPPDSRKGRFHREGNEDRFPVTNRPAIRPVDAKLPPPVQRKVLFPLEIRIGVFAQRKLVGLGPIWSR